MMATADGIVTTRAAMAIIASVDIFSTIRASVGEMPILGNGNKYMWVWKATMSQVLTHGRCAGKDCT